MKPFILLLSVMLVTGCASVRNAPGTQETDHFIADGKLFTAVWQQHAAEYKALCLQAFNTATLRLDEYLQQDTSQKPPAVITDIDETFLDNSPYAIHQALQGKDYEPSSWEEWVNKAEADTLAGALAFFSHAASRNVEVFYISNRDEAGRAATLANLRKYHFPYADDAHLLLQGATSSKEERRQTVAEKHDVILLLGDNLGDFSALFDNKTTVQRAENVLQQAGDFGKRFIMFPNATYGDWEGALYRYNYRLSPAQKDAVFRIAGKGY